MSQGRKWDMIGTATGCAALLAMLSVTSPVLAQDEQPVAVNNGSVSLNLGVDWTTEYWFRGIGQQNEGIIVQPYADVTLNLIKEGPITIDGYVGTWNSLHDQNPGDMFYEADYFAGLSFGLPGNFSFDTSYIVLYNPSGGGIFAEEVDLGLSYDDTELAERLGLPVLAPYALVGIETDGGSDAGTNKGTYLEIGIEPSFTVLESETHPVSLAIPLKVGMSIEDYYENTTGDDDTFGYFDAGLVLSMPIGCIPAEYGLWTASAGVHFLFLGDTAQDISSAFGTGDDELNIFTTVGLSMSY